ncbi:glycosyltransferase [Vibrio olivae]
MEAMAKGLITLSTYHSGIPELIENDVSGYLVNEASINELSDTLIKISQLSPEKVESIRRNAREKCESEFNNITLNKNIFNYSNLVLV